MDFHQLIVPEVANRHPDDQPALPFKEKEDGLVLLNSGVGEVWSAVEVDGDFCFLVNEVGKRMRDSGGPTKFDSTLRFEAMVAPVVGDDLLEHVFPFIDGFVVGLGSRCDRFERGGFSELGVASKAFQSFLSVEFLMPELIVVGLEAVIAARFACAGAFLEGVRGNVKKLFPFVEELVEESRATGHGVVQE